MKALIILLFAMMMCSSCAALPAEERAFAVALCVEKDGAWRVHGRIPTYQSGGGYMTVTGEGQTFPAALSDMDATSPMRINLSQLRLLVADVKLAQSGELSSLLSVLSDRSDMRQQCAVALTDGSVKAVAEALKPTAGSRLSKAIDLMLAARIEQGTTLQATLSDVLRMGQRQSPILASLTLKGNEITLSGGYTMEGIQLTDEETALLSVLLGSSNALRLNLPGGSAEVRDASAKIRLSEDCSTARVELSLNATSSTFTESGLEQVLVDALLTLLPRLSADGCDALGLGRKAIIRVYDMAGWHAMKWPEKYRSILWEVAVGVNGPE